MVHVCFAIYDPKGTYSKYGAIALRSLLEHTDSKLTVHVICDDTISDNIRLRLKNICDDFQQELIFHKINLSDFYDVIEYAKSFTIGALFRLKLPDLLDSEISKIIYFDADTLINTNIRHLWDLDVTDYYVAACHDDGLEDEDVVMSDGLVPASKYYNSGVMVFNIEKIRENFNLLADSAEYFKKHLHCLYPDQDALNYFFMDNVLYLDPKYNMFTRNKRGRKLPLEDGIYHYAGDYVSLEAPEEFDKKYIEYMSLIHWDNNTGLDGFLWGYVNNAHKKINTLQSLCHWLSNRNYKIVVWGPGSIYTKNIYNIVDSSVIDFFVDNNKKIQETVYDNKVVKAPDCLVGRNDTKIIVISKQYYEEIKLQLESYGYKEGIDFIDGMLLLLQAQGGRVYCY